MSKIVPKQRRNPEDNRAAYFSIESGIMLAAAYRLINEQAREKRIQEVIGLTDHLSKLLNRHGAEREFIRMLSEAARHNIDALKLKEPNGPEPKLEYVILLMIDADNFKQLNDTFGHAAGDEAICKIADAMKSIFRRSPDLKARNSVQARFGGEEFIAAFSYQQSPLRHQTPEEEAFNMAEILRQYIEMCCPLEVDGTVFNFTVSIGVAVVAPVEAGMDHIHYCIDQMRKKADAGLYNAKALGRNRVAFEPKFEIDPENEIGGSQTRPDADIASGQGWVFSPVLPATAGSPSRPCMLGRPVM